MPALMIPVSTRPTGTVPIPPILYTSWRGRRSGLSVGRVGGSMASIASSRVLPLKVVPPLHSRVQPLYHVILRTTVVFSPKSKNPSVHTNTYFGDSSNMLSPCHPEIGTKATALGLYPTFLMKLVVSLMISLNRSSDHWKGKCQYGRSEH